jgi:O-antigen/teichoic acid export membrane protein
MLRKLLSAQAILLAARLLGAALGFCSQLLLARVLTPTDLATFYAATSMAAIGGLVCAQGYSAIAARFISRYRERNRPRELAGFVGRARRATFAAAGALAAALCAFAIFWPGLAEGSRPAWLIAAVAIPAFASTSLYTAFGGAIRRFYASLLPEMIIRPAAFFLIVAAMLFAGIELSGAAAVFLMCGVCGAAAVAQWLSLRRHMPASGPSPSAALARRWRQEAWPLVLVMVFTGLFADLAILVASPFLVGIDLAAFSICIKLALLVGYAVQIAHQFVLPDLADAYARRDLRNIERRLRLAAALPVSICLAALIATHLFGAWILAIFGDHFAYAAGPLTLMILCQLLRAVAGPTTSMLTLEGAQRTNALCCGVSTLVLVAATAGLAPTFGLWGATIALTIAYVAWLGATAVALYRLSGIRADLPALIGSALARRVRQSALSIARS